MMVALDWDGTVCTYKFGPAGMVLDESFMPGAVEFMKHLIESKHKIAFFSARIRHHQNVKDMIIMLRNEGLLFEPTDFWPKPPANHIIDDRAIRFTGSWDQFASDDWLQYDPWYYKSTLWRGTKPLPKCPY